MNRRQKIIVSVTGIFLVLLLLVGLTYAYFLTQITGNTNNKSISVSTANLALVYGDGNGVIEADEAILPGSTLDSKTFTVKNEGNDTAEYVVVIEDVSVTNVSDSSTTTFESNDFVYTLTCTSDGADCNGIDTEATFPITGGILIGNSVEVGKTHTYSLTVTYKETGVDQSADMNKTLTAKVNIADPNGFNPYVGDKGSLVYTIINNAVTATTVEKEAGYAEFRPTSLTALAVETSERYETTGEEATSESSISISTTYQSYYWTYSTGYTVDPATGKFTLTGVSTCQYNDGSCHETLVGKYIVSTSAYGNSSSTNTQKTTTDVTSIYKVTTAPASSTSTITMKAKKINPTYYSVESTLSTTLDDYGTSYYYRGDVENNYLEFNNMCWRIVRIEGDGSIKITLAAQKSCSEITDSDTGTAFIGTGDYGYTEDDNDNNIYFADYENSAARTTSMKYKFNDWFDTNLSSVSSKLKTTQACIGDTTNAYTSDGVLMTESEKQKEIPYGSFYYNSYVRLYGTGQTANATLLCNGDRTSETQIFPLTADEVVFAGGKAGTYNYSYYLRDNASDNNWLIFSLSSFGSGTDTAFNVYANGYVGLGYYVAYIDVSLRPAVSLISGTQFLSGDGSIENPYKIK